MRAAERYLDEALQRLEVATRHLAELHGGCAVLIRAIRTGDHPTPETLDRWSRRLDSLTPPDFRAFARWVVAARHAVEKEARRPRASRPRRTRR